MGKKFFHEEVFGIIFRYIILILVALSNLWIFYAIFTPITVYPSYWILGLSFTAALISKDIILINGSIPIQLIEACIAGSAYYLLLILNLSIPRIKIGKRLIMIFASFASLLLLNLIRIVLLVHIYVEGSPLFDLTHEVFWYALSTVFVVGIWFAEVKLFKVRDIPVYSDLKLLFKLARAKKR